MKPTIYFAADHAGFALKNELLIFVRDVLLYEVVDCGAYVYDEADDFNTYIAKASEFVSAQGREARAIILGGSGQGEAMLANRYDGVRAVVYYGGSTEIVSLSRVHNDANILSLGARFLTQEEAKAAVTLWLETEHTPVEKYERRNSALDAVSSDTKMLAKVPVTLVPSLPATSFAQIDTLLVALRGVALGVQIDMVDGVFAPYTSWPFTELDVEDAILALSTYSLEYEVEVDCMCMHPEEYLDIFVEANVARVVIHVGTTEKYVECIAHAKSYGYKIGFGIRNATPLDFLVPYVHDIDFVQVMGIEHIGIQGQAFDVKTIETVAYLHHTYPHLEIAVDGAVNEHTIKKLIQAGATRLAPGSAVTKTKDPASSYKQLKGMIGA